MKTSIALMAVALLAAGSVTAQEEAVTDLDRFELWNECKPVELVVERLDEDAVAIGLSREDITVAARSRLRSARIYSTDPTATWLYIRVTVASFGAHSVQIGFRKALWDLITGERGSAETWNKGSIGTHGNGGAVFILSTVSQHLDQFIDEYLRVNAEACS